MWVEAFKRLMKRSRTLPSALLRGLVLPEDTAPYERASAVMAVQMAMASLTRPQRLILMVPAPTENLPRVIAAGLLMADLVHQRRKAYVLSKEESLLKGDLLLVTHAVGTAIDELRKLRLGDILLQNVWSVSSYSRYTQDVDLKPRVYVANAGWVLDGFPGRCLEAAVIDATHPRTLVKLPQLLNLTENLRLLIAITPPLLEADLESLGYPEKTCVWLWDPEAQRAIEEVVACRDVNPSLTIKRHIWVCDNTEIDGVLAELYEMLALCMRKGSKPFPPLWDAWSLYHRLRQLAVPLVQLEEFSCTTWGVIPFRKRLERLRGEWPSDAFLEAYWPRITAALQKVYDLLLNSKEPPKFWSVAERVIDFLDSSDPPRLRIVVPTSREGTILSILLSQLDNNWLEAQREGRIEVITVREEMRLVGADRLVHTLLLGYRASSQRYMDLYPPHDTEVIAYPHEVGIDEILQEKIYYFAESLQESEVREFVLRGLGIATNSVSSVRKSPRPVVKLAGKKKYEIRQILPLEPGPLDLERLAGIGPPIAWDEDVREEDFEKGNEAKGHGKLVEVVFAEGRKVRYQSWQPVYVYNPIVEQVRRYVASDVQPGMHLVILVDAVYEGLYDRVLEAIKSLGDPNTPIILKLWNESKSKLLQKYSGNRRVLYETLQQRGLRVGYAAFTKYFHGDDLDEQTLAPHHYLDMKLMAEFSGLYPSEKMIRLTFGAIQQERQRRRAAGRLLKKILRAIVTGEGYQQALESARLLGRDVGEVLAAVEVRTVRDVRVIDRDDGVM